MIHEAAHTQNKLMYYVTLDNPINAISNRNLCVACATLRARVHVLTIAPKQEVSIKSPRGYHTNVITHSAVKLGRIARVKITIIEGSRHKKGCVNAIFSENYFFIGRNFMRRARSRYTCEWLGNTYSYAG